jgi:hypothetical protein
MEVLYLGRADVGQRGGRVPVERRERDVVEVDEADFGEAAEK